MISGIAIMYVIFPLVILYKVKYYPKLKYNDNMISRDESNIIKGVAASMVLFAHYTSWLHNDGMLFSILLPFSKLGPLGVALFFFLSGYGLTISNGFKRQKVSFLVKRIVNIYVPYLVLRLLFYPFCGYQYVGIEKLGYFMGFIKPDWFVIVIMLLYIIYYLVSYAKRNKLLLLTILVLLLSLVLFILLGIEDSHWYQGNLCFALGAGYANYYGQINNFVKKRYLVCFGTTVLVFVIACFIEICTNEMTRIFMVSIADVCVCVLCIVLMQKVELKSPVMNFLGKYSLYIYIVHLSVHRVYNKYEIIFTEGSSLVYFALSLILSIILKKVLDWVISRQMYIGEAKNGYKESL